MSLPIELVEEMIHCVVEVTFDVRFPSCHTPTAASRRDLLSCALSCSAFFHLTMKNLWSNSELMPLLKLLPGLEAIDGSYVLIGQLDEASLKRFDLYSSKVKTLVFSPPKGKDTGRQICLHLPDSLTTQTTSIIGPSAVWGEEVSRLTPCPVAILPDVGVDAVPSQDPSKRLQFTRQPFKSQSIPISVDEKTLGRDSLLNKIVLSPSETRAVTLACNKAKCTLTALLNSILILADVEKTLRTSHIDLKAENSTSLANAVEENWQKAEVWCVPANPADLRAYIYPRYQVAHGSCTTGGVVNLMLPTYHSMVAIRKCVTLKDGAVLRSWYDNPAYFWDYMVKDTQALLKTTAMQPPHVFHTTSAMEEAFCPMMAEDFGAIIPFRLESCLPQLGKWSDWSASDAEPPFLLADFAGGVRSHHSPLIIINCWEYNERLVLNIQGSKRKQTAEGWEIFGQVVREGLNQIVKQVDAKATSEKAKAVL
ncbi:hypothetical protein D9758_007491 [Tetrapyrgos nigripes]|uniref:Uncharacterized protein n=1 Tax=Tetrapyrgos nigripes TaxID=182062 RepID=A0A8H5G3H1_9AGAR|nr:hypothetical protein D9758_007491 [Tetrapyrgos nigripes]